MIKCEICGRTIDEIVEQDGSVTIQEDMPLVCDRCQQKEQFDKQVEILRKAMDYDKIKQQLDKQKKMWNKLKEWLNGYIEYHEALKVESAKVTGIYRVGNNIDVSYVLDKMQELDKG